MNNLITFSARGTKIFIPKALLKKYPDTLLCNICNYDNIPTDKINNEIFIDINPANISTVVKLYHNSEIEEIDINSISLYMDLKYLGFMVEYHKILPYMNDPVNYSTEVETLEINNLEYVNIHTIENDIIIVDINTINNWIDCKFKSIIVGKYTDYIIDQKNDYLDIWIGLNTFKTHYILSILRDGLNWYYYDYPLTYNKNVNNIVNNYKCQNIEGSDEIEFYGSGDYYFQNNIDREKNTSYLKERYHKLRYACRNDSECDDIISTVDINFKLNKKKIKNIMNNIDIVDANQNQILNIVKELEGAMNYNQYVFDINNKNISEYVIDHKILYFYGLLNDDVKMQLENRRTN